MLKKRQPEISIIIPTLNEAAFIGKLLNHLFTNSHDPSGIEVLVIDGGSSDATIQLAKEKGAMVYTSDRGRAKQMNLGAQKAQGLLLYFLHADTYPPKHFDLHLKKARLSRIEAGCFRMRFATKNLFLRFFAFLTRFNLLICRGGDQSLFVDLDLFKKSGGFDENYQIYEDTEFIGRIVTLATFRVLPEYVVTSARKYQKMGYLYVQFHFAIIHLKNYLGASPGEMADYYRKHLLS